MLLLQQETTTEISPDCIKTCPWHPDTIAIAHYQTHPHTAGSLAVASITSPEHIASIQTIQTPPLLHLAWVKIPSRPQ